MAGLRKLRTLDGSVLDKGLVLFFAAPRSFTGEDCGELHVHGGKAVVAACLATLAHLPHFRLAEAGEFTRRAFENGKLDLTEAEGLADLIEAETETQRRLAVDQSGGQLRRLYDGWANRLLHARAMIEAELDFADEDDVPGSVSQQIWVDMALLISEMDAHLSGARTAELIRDGFRVALVGRPNVGKSTLLNRLADREAAIVSEEAGTTRDIVEVRIDLDGSLVLLQDTAGLRTPESKIEQEGIRRTLDAIAAADLVLHLIDGDGEDGLPAAMTAQIIRIRTKIDMVPGIDDECGATLCISAQEGIGIDVLLSRLQTHVSARLGHRQTALPTRIRHVALIKACLSEIKVASAEVELGPELRAEHLRSASDALGRITGRIDVDDLLGVIFASFCIGK